LGEKADLVIKPEYAYGKEGKSPLIPADATLIYKVEIFVIKDREITMQMMNDEELVAVAAKLKEYGNLKYKASDM